MTADTESVARSSQHEHTSRTQKLLTKLLQGRESEWTGVAEKSKPLRLLDLPVDVLQVIVKELTHTNDLTSLALTHSALHSLVTPHIYSRFDIVWPEANPTLESRVGVDALTYGLATLVMAHDVFGEASHQQRCQSCQHCQEHKPVQAHQQSRDLRTRIRRGNYFAQYTRKFSLGNGPADWVTEYLITKEGGKMLGTLVALALGRMRNLEVFIWDMPTGVLRDVWLALASLGNRDDGRDCRLEKVWVRWHDNRDAAPPGSSMQHTNLPSLLQGTATSLFQIPPYPSVEFPTFSILPALKSISVLDIDEVPYAEELSILLERSLERLEELRVGVAAHAQRDLPFRPIDDRSAVPPPFLSSDEYAKPGGLLGILVGRFCSAHNNAQLVPVPTSTDMATSGAHVAAEEEIRPLMLTKDTDYHSMIDPTDMNQLGVLLSAQSLQDDSEGLPVSISGSQAIPPAQIPTVRKPSPQITPASDRNAREQHSRKLKLTTLELERVYLSIPVLSCSIDWSRLESLTLLGCMNHEQLWKALRRKFTPVPARNKTPISKFGSASPQQRGRSASYTVDLSEYKLGIRKLHTNTVSKALLAFIKDTLAPDTLEWLFLQETPAYKSTVTIDEIYKSAIRRHKGSLRKLLIDSDLKLPPHVERDGGREREHIDMSWRRWTCNQDLITCITSGKMQLRELSLSIDYKYWHYFLQRLPNATDLRSLHISHIADHPYGRPFDPRDVALQVLDIISLRPEIEMCYLGVEKKCFEILEYKSSNLRRNSPSPSNLGTIGITTHTMIEDDDDDEHDDGGAAHHVDHFSADQSDEDEDNWDVNSHGSSNMEEVEDDEDDDERDGNGKSKAAAFRLREILFYDDKISIFKARHGKL